MWVVRQVHERREGYRQAQFRPEKKRPRYGSRRAHRTSAPRRLNDALRGTAISTSGRIVSLYNQIGVQNGNIRGAMSSRSSATSTCTIQARQRLLVQAIRGSRGWGRDAPQKQGTHRGRDAHEITRPRRRSEYQHMASVGNLLKNAFSRRSCLVSSAKHVELTAAAAHPSASLRHGASATPSIAPPPCRSKLLRVYHDSSRS